MSVVSPEFGEFLREAQQMTSDHRVCVVSLYLSDGRVVEFGDSGPGVRESSGEAGPDLPLPDLVLEVPHGATRKLDYQILKNRLSPDLPEDLIDYFFVNTDVGSTEVACRVATELASRLVVGDSAAGPGGSALLRSVLVLRCLIPRTFIDTNRVIDRSTLEESDGEKLSNAFPDYIRTEADQNTLLSLYESYHQIAGRAHALVCDGGGLSIMPHTYAPRSIGIDSFDEGIGKALRAAYEPELYGTWKIRPQVDFITQPGNGGDAENASDQPEKLAPMDLVEAVRSRYEALDVGCAENESYPLHPASMAHHYSARHPGQALCFEIRRDLLADPFSPFDEMTISPEKVAHMSGPIVESVLEWFGRSDRS